MKARPLFALPLLALAGCTIVTQPPPGAAAAPAPRATAAPAPTSPAAQPRPAATPAPAGTPAATTAATTPPARPTQTAAAPATPRPAAQPAATAKAPEKPAPITSVDLEVYNNCGAVLEYCVDDISQLSTSITSNTYTHHSVRPGAKIRHRKGSSCTDVIYTVNADSPSQKTNLCR